MRLTQIFISVATFTLLGGCANAQTDKSNVSDSNFVFSPKKAHPKAKALLIEDFYWSPIEETGPFGSDDGWDAAYSFRKWRSTNKTTSPIIFLKGLIKSWQYPYFDWAEMDSSKIISYINSEKKLDDSYIEEQLKIFKEILKNSADTTQKNTDDSTLRTIIIESAKSMNGTFLLGQDNAIIGTCFAQFALEGTIDKELKDLTKLALKRQLLPILIDRYDEPYKTTRTEQLTKMLLVLDSIH